MTAGDEAAKQHESSHPVATDTEEAPEEGPSPAQRRDDADNEEVDVEEEEVEDDAEEEEPKLKYDKLTGRFAGVYRNGDSTSSFTIAGNKIVLGTHNGNIHVLSLPAIQPLRTYHAHSATITSCSVSPITPPPTVVRRADGSGNFLLPQPGLQSRNSLPIKNGSASTRASKSPQKGSQQVAIPSTPDNAVYIATSSLDGHVCISSLIDPKDVQLRNFARPVNAVALSPEYKSDRTYLSGGRAGQLIVTVGGKTGVSSEANTNSAAAAASGWLGSIGLGSNSGRDSILHQGEGAISTIKWSLSGKWIVWVNEEGVKVMRSHLRLGSEESEDAWRRIAHAAKPNRRAWEDMAGVWKAHAQWVDERALEADHIDITANGTHEEKKTATAAGASKRRKRSVDTLVVGWGDTAWILHVHEGGSTVPGTPSSKRQVGSADIVHKLQFRDCIVSGVSLYSPSLVAILAYRTRDDNDQLIASTDSTNDKPRRGRSHKHTALAPQLRLVNVHDGEEVDVDELPMSRFETLSAQDYHLESLWIPLATPGKSKESKGTLEGLWEASGGYYASKMFSSGASMLSQSSSGIDENGRQGSNAGTGGSALEVTPTDVRSLTADAHPFLLEPGLKLFIQSPYDCVLAVKRQLSDHLDWLLTHHQYAQAWSLIDKHPEVVDTSTTDQRSISSGALASPNRAQQSLADFLGSDETASVSSRTRDNSAAVREKRRIGDLWLAQLVASEQWGEAGAVAYKVLQGSSRWEHWVLYFAQSGHFDEITPSVPTKSTQPAVPSLVYEVILGHYIVTAPTRACQLLDDWDEDVFEAGAVVSAIETRLASQDVKEGSEDWKGLLEALGHLYLGMSKPREALKCYIRTQNAERAFALVQEEKVADTLEDNVPAFLTLKVSREQMQNATLEELDELSEQAVALLVEESHRGTITTASTIRQIRKKGPAYQPFLFFYLRALWRGTDNEKKQANRGMFNRKLDEGHAMVEDHADLAVEIFAEYDRTTLLEFLQTSEVYDYNRAATICEQRHYIPELVLVLNRTGQVKRALWLIIGELGDVAQAIAFVKQNTDLWDDLLEYGMDKPRFIRGLLEEVGTSVDAVKLVKRIPEGLEVEGLKNGILKLVQGWEVQLEVSRGVERVLRGEVIAGMDVLRQGQKRGVRFEVLHENEKDIDLAVVPPPLEVADEAKDLASGYEEGKSTKPGHCEGCGELFHEDETEPLLGFACGHVCHLSCLLRMNDDTSDPKTFERVTSQLGYGGATQDEREGYGARSVGAKVAHAHVIRNVIDGGCRSCPTIPGA